MEILFITDLFIEKIRHLEDVHIAISKDKLKHLLITGRNGSGKTSVLDAMAGFLNSLVTTNDPMEAEYQLMIAEDNLRWKTESNQPANDITVTKKNIEYYCQRISDAKNGISLQMNCPLESLRTMFENGEFIVAYYKAERIFHAETPKHVEKVELKDHYMITETPRNSFVKYLLDLKMTEALALTGGKTEKADKIKCWYEKFENLLQRIFEEDSLKLEFDEDTFHFSICMPGRETFDFNTLSSGYAAVLDIVVDIILRMEKQTNKTFDFNMPGIVLVDEIETHLHLELQKKILDLLTTVFPKVQFIVSTHSPFILNSLENAVVYDLENRILAEDGLADIPYDGIVEGYFKADTLSVLLRNKYERYKELVRKEEVSDEEFEEIARLELFLDEIPDYLALGITTEYRKLKLEFESREDM